MREYMRRFYRSAKVSFIAINLIWVAVWLLAVRVSDTDAKIAASFGLSLTVVISSFLLRYFKNLIADVCLEGETVCILLSDDSIFRYDRAGCTGIEKYDHLIKLYFKDGKVFSMPRYYLFKKFDFDFSIFDQSNFPNAKIENRI